MPPQHHNFPIRQMPNQLPAAANTPQHKPSLPNRVLARAFDAAFQQAGGSSRFQSNQSQTSTNMESPMAGSMANPGVQLGHGGHTPQHGARQMSTNMQMHASPIPGSMASPGVQSFGQGANTPQHGARPMNTNLQMHPSPMSDSMASPGGQPLNQYGGVTTPQHGARPLSTNMQINPSPMSGTMITPGAQSLNQNGGVNPPQHGARPLSTNMQSHDTSVSPIAHHQSGGMEAASPGVLPPSQSHVEQHGARTLNTHMTKYRPILPASPPPAPVHLPRRLVYQSPPAGGMPHTATAPSGHQRPSQSPCAVATHHTSIHHSPLMTSNPAAQHPSQMNLSSPQPQVLNRVMSSHQAASASYPSHQIHNHPGQTAHGPVLGSNQYGSFQFPSSPPPIMQTPIPEQSPVVAKIVPSFRPHKPRNLSSQPPGSSLSSSKIVPTFKPAAKQCITPTFAAKVQLNFDDVELKDGPPPLQQQQVTGVGSTPGYLASNLAVSQQTPMKPSFGAKTPSIPVGDKSSKSVKRKAKVSNHLYYICMLLPFGGGRAQNLI